MITLPTLLARARRHWSLVVPIAVSAVLSSWALGTVGWGNTYYSAAVRSMSESWSAFWYGSLDSAGFVTVDKPPFSLWVQALAVRVFGFHSLTLLVPQVLAGVGAVVLVYATLVRGWGRVAATVGACALAVAPISVMVNHSNNTDAVLTLMMTATVFAGVRAAERGSWRWMVVAALCFGAAFTTKMLAAAPALPAFLLAVALAAPLVWRRRAVLLAGGATIAVATALLWFTVVDLTPADARPYVGSSVTNSAYQLAFERNGVNQVEGEQVMTGSAALPNLLHPDQRAEYPGGAGPGGAGPGGAGPGGGPTGGAPNGAGPTGFDGGGAGWLRLFNAELGTQIGWLVAPAVAGLVGALVLLRRRVVRDPVVVAATVWFVGGALAYSVTEGIVHPYYVASIVPPLALLIGVGAGILRERCSLHSTWVVAGAAVATSGAVSWVVARRSDWRAAALVALGATALGLAVVLAAALAERIVRGRAWLLPTLAAVGVLAVPSVWTAGSLKAGLSANLPYAQPVAVDTFARPGGAGPSGGPGQWSGDDAVVQYLREHRGTTTWLAATPSARTAGSIIIATGEPVMALGGFSGGDPILSDDEFDALVDEGRVRFVLLEGVAVVRLPADANGGDGVAGHVRSTCAVVSEVSDSLYDCAVTS